MKTSHLLLLFFSFFFLLSCEDALECLFGINPEINETSVASATLDQEYFQRITAEIDNEVNDDAYFYYFDVFGELPLGIEVLYFPREIQLVGVPEETGEFGFSVYLTIEGYDDGFEYDPNPTCADGTNRAFTLVVNE